MTRRQPDPLTVAAAAHRGAEAADPSGADADVGAFAAHLEDDDSPLTAVAGLSDRLEEARRAADPEGDAPAVTMAAAVANYLAYRREEASDDREDLLRLAARAEFEGGHPPEEVAGWLRAQGVQA
jgi:hypothetical protein